ncbi:MAG: pyridoxal phosphate-dependent aminotransferase [Lachnospiraceae bacterium]|nr:pyridoxal phosphate-dependent aminotransferase [Lachnospiraceae bacterium]
MNFDFDRVTERKGTNSLKYDFAKERGKAEDVLPLWVADMDFPAAPCILERLEKAVKHGIFGYTESKEDYFAAVSGWYRERFGWEPKASWLVKTPGVVFAIAMAIRAFTAEGDAVLIQQPVYYPFGQTIKANNRKLVNSPLKLVDGKYEMDFEDLEQKIITEHVKLFVLCSPHNPVGRVWTEEELRRVGDICLKYHVLIVADEIHSDFVYEGHKHHIFASLGEKYADNAIICTAPSKTFNLAGLQNSNIFIPNANIRKQFNRQIDATGYCEVNAMGLFSCQAAYEGGAQWLDELKVYLKGNLDYIREFLKERLPEIKLVEPEGTYLVWLDFRELGLTEAQLEELVVEKAKLWLDSGTMFGPEGEGFERVNITCPRSVLKQALEQLESAVHA